ncbi:sensor histidine kinase [Myceligenerans pegani]|uniref:histidine kinase n=1 Tax=Myceligenerans pegani TaxID=2776917 RepID=A0ABR9MX16_9MICO|nr:histidine kinase [Myceligenerans sp. TRM 65318]MBE1875469.1 two-component sensor histidine kinase [Myceligenerans sp. TRM 65318]MBE3017740.1 two-component sensor histidine kinase [Myceligenerans sp. TRM 65318]
MTALRPPVADRLLAAGSFVLGVVAALTLQVVDFDGERRVDLWAVLLLGAISVPLLARRRRPILVVLVVLAVSMPYHLLDYPHEATMPASLVAAFAAARYSEPHRRPLAVLVAVGVVTVPVLADETSGALGDALLGVGWLFMAFFAGLAVRFRENWKAVVAARQEQERADEVERRVTEERVLIAAELHDVLAHGLAVANVQASVAAHLIDQLPDRGDETLRELSSTLHDLSDTSGATLRELRAVLDVLHGGETEPTEPAPHLGELQHLVEMAEAADVRIDLETAGLPDELPSTVSVVAYRIIQESLTNVIRHSMAKQATVRLDQDGNRLRITIVDHGPAQPSSVVTPAGFGIAGMTRRAQAVGGELSAGPHESGGFEVRASLPLPETWRVPT